MNPHPLFCPNLSCPSRGVEQTDNIRPHDTLRDRWRCTSCGKTFSGRQGTPFHRLRTDEKTVTLVLTLLANGCPLQAIVLAFGFDERTIKKWYDRAGRHCERIHQELVTSHPMDLGQVQADEVRVRLQGRLVIWMAMAIAVPSRLWLGGVCSIMQRPARQASHSSTGRYSEIVRVLWSNSALDGRAQELCERMAQSIPHAGAYGQARPSADARLAGSGHRPSSQKVQERQQRSCRRRRAAARAGEHPGASSASFGREEDQHRLHRATERDLPSKALLSGQADPLTRSQTNDLVVRNVSGGLLVQLLQSASEPCAKLG